LFIFRHTKTKPAYFWASWPVEIIVRNADSVK